MKPSMITKQNGTLPGQVRHHSDFSQMQTTRIIRAASYDGYDFSLTIIKPILSGHENCLLPVFLFIPPKPDTTSCIRVQEQFASQLVIATGQAAVMINYPSSRAEIPVFDLFATMKWISLHGSETGMNGNKLAIVGSHLGANVAAVLCLMALADCCPEISLQILIDPVFFISQRHISPRRMHFRGEINGTDNEWLDMKYIYDLPLDSKVEKLTGLPPTLIQLSANTGNYCELEYYCAKLLHTGTDVTCIHYDEYDDESAHGTASLYNRNLLENTAAELRKYGWQPRKAQI